jgi:hypothetical protein
MSIYGKDCGCNAPVPAPKAINVNVTPSAPTESVVCPDARCLDYMLSSAPESEAATESVMGMHKGRSYVVPMSAMLNAYLKSSLNALYKTSEIPAVVNYRDLEAVQVTQKSNCDKVAIAPLTVLAQAIAEATPKAPAGYNAVTVQTYDKDGAPYLATPLQVVGPAFIDAAIENCPKMKNVPLITQLMGFGKDCTEYGMTSIKQLAEALAKSLKLAPTKQLPDGLRGFKAGVEELYPVKVEGLKGLVTQAPASAGGPIAASGNLVLAAQSLAVTPGLWAFRVEITGAIAWNSTAGGYAFFQIAVREGGPSGNVLASSKIPVYFAPGSSSLGGDYAASAPATGFVYLPAGGNIYADYTVYAKDGHQKIGAGAGSALVIQAQQLSQSNLVMNEVL